MGCVKISIEAKIKKGTKIKMSYLSHFRPTIFSWQGHLPLTFKQTKLLDPPARQLQSLHEEKMGRY